MERSLEIYSDGRVFEIEGDYAVRVTETHGNVDQLIKVLQFSVAPTFSIAPPDKVPPDLVERRGTKSINQTGFELLTTFEGCHLTAYDDGGGVWTIGYGHTGKVRPGQTITQSEADQLLHQDLERFESYVQDAIKTSVNDSQFSALVCFCFNVGPGTGGLGDSTLLRLLNQGDYNGAAGQFPRWNKVDGKPWLGLTRRRLAEQALFQGQPWRPFLNYQESAPVASASRVLKLTNPLMQGEDVRQLQQALTKAGLQVGVADGYFGKSTEAAVKQFQQKKGLTADGIVGNATRQALGLRV
jgi:GH24 family phage-related lysozyme (muramidase)